MHDGRMMGEARVLALLQANPPHMTHSTPSAPPPPRVHLPPSHPHLLVKGGAGWYGSRSYAPRMRIVGSIVTGLPSPTSCAATAHPAATSSRAAKERAVRRLLPATAIILLLLQLCGSAIEAAVRWGGVATPAGWCDSEPARCHSCKTPLLCGCEWVMGVEARTHNVTADDFPPHALPRGPTLHHLRTASPYINTAQQVAEGGRGAPKLQTKPPACRRSPPKNTGAL